MENIITIIRTQGSSMDASTRKIIELRYGDIEEELVAVAKEEGIECSSDYEQVAPCDPVVHGFKDC